MADYYSLPFVCFKCRKAFNKKPQFSAPMLLHENSCPQCGRALAFVGRYFKAPPRQNLKQWRKVQLLYESGWRADGYQARHLSTLRAAKTHLREQQAQEHAAIIRRKQENQQQKWSKMRK
jgi:DNA-directed RNA polymerase subunit RPC12/RpoP